MLCLFDLHFTLFDILQAANYGMPPPPPAPLRPNLPYGFNPPFLTAASTGEQEEPEEENRLV